MDHKLNALLEQEEKRQTETINLIASENYTDKAIRAVMASVLTDKYAEGYPGKRYYGGCRVIDEVELLAQERVKTLFGAEHANVQPHSGSQANLGVYMALLAPGDTILGMKLADGGHLTHGHKVNFSGSWYTSIQYGVHPETELIDYDQVQALAEAYKPKIIIAGASSYSRIIDFERFSHIAKSVGAYLMVDCAHTAGLIAAGVHPNPTPYADIVTFTTHKTLRGPRGGVILCKKELASIIDRGLMPGLQGGPFMHTIAAKALAFKLAATQEFKVYQQQVIKNAQAMAHEFKKMGYRIVSDGTDTHLFVCDISHLGLSGKEVEEILEGVDITLNRNCIPFDKRSPVLTSGLRIGTPAITTRGANTDDVRKIASLIDRSIINYQSPHELASIKKEVHDMCEKLVNQLNSDILPFAENIHNVYSL